MSGHKGVLGELWELVGRIPSGRCASYGDLGRALTHPASGRLVGMWMANCPEGIPWWRVVSRSGEVPIHKRDPRLAKEQRERLAKEGVRFVDERVDMLEVQWDPLEAAE